MRILGTLLAAAALLCVAFAIGRASMDPLPGPAGINGKNGVDGRDGVDGKPGRDCDTKAIATLEKRIKALEKSQCKCRCR